MPENDIQWQLEVLKFEYDQKEADIKAKYSTKVKCHGHGEYYSDYDIASALNHQEYEEKRRELLGLPKEDAYRPVHIPLIRRAFPEFLTKNNRPQDAIPLGWHIGRQCM
ncbi:MAG: hypothetical protein MJZ25_08910 [Fibrobacter sp.]|nr:hypothetical protein [Fibrobacter sp.]